MDLLRLNDAAHRHLVDAVDRKIGTSAGPNKRQDRRYRYACEDGLVAVLLLDKANRLSCIVRPRNISRGGISLFHGQFVHSGTPCVLNLKKLDDTLHPVAGVVRFCRHIFGHIHEVGVQFRDPIEVVEYAQDPELARAAERSAKQKRTGHVVCVAPDEATRSLMKFHAQEIGALVSEADDAPEGLDLVRCGGINAVVCSLEQSSMPGLEFVEAVREEGYGGPLGVWHEADAGAIYTLPDGCHQLAMPFDPHQIKHFFESALLPIRRVTDDDEAEPGDPVSLAA